jgi:hypothetical protein
MNAKEESMSNSDELMRAYTQQHNQRLANFYAKLQSK